MDPKETIKPRVVVEYVVDKDMDNAKTHYAAGFVDGVGGSDIVLVMPIGRHLFSRTDGTWRGGDCLNYIDAKIMNFGKVEAAIQAGYLGDVEMYEKSIPMCAAS